MGEYIFSGMFEPILTRSMQQYKIPVHLGEAFHGQSGQDDFHLDIRSVQAPYIGDGFMDMYLVGETWYQDRGCPSPLAENNIHFINNHEMSQIVITESAFSCMLN